MKGLIRAGAFALVCGTAASALAQNTAPAADSRDRSYNSTNKDEGALKPAYSAGDASFFKNAAAGGLAEVAAGRTAEKQARNPQVRDFARQMVKDHSAANQQLAALAQKKGISVPDAPDGKHQQALLELQGKQGPAFDKDYVEGQLADHKDAVSLFEAAAKSTDPEVSAFARKTLPTLQHHLEMVQALQGQS